MIKNYFKIAFRNLRRDSQFSLINIGGLALGLAVFLLIFQYLAFEWKANRFHANFTRLYRGDIVDKDGKGGFYLAPGLAPIIKKSFPGVTTALRVAEGIGSGIISVPASGDTEAKVFREDEISYADPELFNVFSFPLVEGVGSLQEPGTVAMSETVAKKFFGTKPAVGSTITVNNQFGILPYRVVAVYKDIPASSDIRAAMFLSFTTLQNKANRNGNDWADPNTVESGFVQIYFLLKDGVNPETLGKQVTDFFHVLQPDTKSASLVFQPFRHLHLAPSFHYNLPTFGSLPLVVMLLCVGILILAIAFINYINLSTAQSLNRAREVGVRKVLGARRRELVMQYLTETFLITISAVIISVLLVTIMQPFFNDFTGKELSLSVLNEGSFWLAGFTMITVASLLSGCYVAFVLSGFNPAKVIGGKMEPVTRGFSLRKGLVVFQFSISIAFIIATIVLYKQLQFMETQNLGMNISQRVVIKGPTGYNEADSKNSVAFKNALAQLPFIEKYSASNNIPGQGYNFKTSGITSTNPAEGDDKKSFSMLITDEHFFDTYGISFAQGKSFSAEDAQKSWMKAHRVVINEKAAAQLGFDTKENLVGKKILWGEEYEIAGVIKDYHHLTLRQPIEPAIYLPAQSQGYFTVLLNTANLQANLDRLKNLYASLFAGYPFEYFFADEQYDKQYAAEQKLGNVFISAACIAIFIGCMGLFGLAAFSARQRVKEIGIRKVLGATAADITALLSKDFVKLVVISIVIASPIAWWAMNNWLQGFAYRTNVEWWMFLLAGFIAVAIALVTISFQSVKSALANPVKNLRTE